MIPSTTLYNNSRAQGRYSVCIYPRAGGRVSVLAQGYWQGRVEQTFPDREQADRWVESFIAAERQP